MNRNILAGLGFLTLGAVGIGMPALAGDPDPNQCLECHEPSEDWAGMTVDQIIVAARNPDNKRHASHKDLTDEQLRLIIATLLPPE